MKILTPKVQCLMSATFSRTYIAVQVKHLSGRQLLFDEWEKRKRRERVVNLEGIKKESIVNLNNFTVKDELSALYHCHPILL